MTIPVAVYGATGYGGQELLRLLAGHPEFGVAAALSRSQAGVAVETVHPHLAGFYEGLEFTSPKAALPHAIEVAVLAVPHGTAAPIVQRLGDRRIVDLSRDFRALHPAIDPTKTNIETRYDRWTTTDGITHAGRSRNFDMTSGDLVQTAIVLRSSYNLPDDDLDLPRSYIPSGPPQTTH